MRDQIFYPVDPFRATVKYSMEQKKRTVQGHSNKDLLWEILDRLDDIGEQRKKDIPQGKATVIAAVINAIAILGVAVIGFLLLSN